MSDQDLHFLEAAADHADVVAGHAADAVDSAEEAIELAQQHLADSKTRLVNAKQEEKDAVAAAKAARDAYGKALGEGDPSRTVVRPGTATGTAAVQTD